MSLEVKWYDDAHTILIATIAKDTTWDEYHRAVDQILFEASQVDHRVDVIFHDDVGMPAGNPMPQLRAGLAKFGSQPNIKYFIIAGSRGSAGFARTTIEIALKVILKSVPFTLRIKGKFVQTLKYAIAIIEEDRASEKILA